MRMVHREDNKPFLEGICDIVILKVDVLSPGNVDLLESTRTLIDLQIKGFINLFPKWFPNFYIPTYCLFP